MAKTTKTFTLVKRALTPSGLWDNGYYFVSKDTVEIPNHVLKDAIVTTHAEGVKGVREAVSLITVGGSKYLVTGTVKIPA
jgi:hypothetical protein